MPEPCGSIPDTVMSTGELPCHSVGTAVVSCGPVVSTITVCVTQPVALPATSTTLVSRAWVPSGITTAAPLAPLLPPTGAPSTFHSTCPTPDSASVPVTLIVVGVYCQVEGTTVVSTGATLSICTVSLRSVERLPARSSTSVSSVCVPSPVTLKLVPDGTDCTPAPSTSYST